jgi:hypothetical protein
MSEATVLLNTGENGGQTNADKLLELLYEELRRLAICKLAKEAPGHTLQPTALVHEPNSREIMGEAIKSSRAGCLIEARGSSGDAIQINSSS